MSVSLKPCPFCGAAAEIVSAPMGIIRSMGYAVRCTGCGVQTETDFNQGKPVTQWESRAAIRQFAEVLQVRLAELADKRTGIKAVDCEFRSGVKSAKALALTLLEMKLK
jgi:Lar family restriction alleviation protein